jgi:hypothetical protein
VGVLTGKQRIVIAGGTVAGKVPWVFVQVLESAPGEIFSATIFAERPASDTGRSQAGAPKELQRNMSSTKSKLRLICSFAALGALALAVSCQGFFPHATLQSIALQPQSPAFGIGLQQPMQAWGTDSNGNRYQLTTGVSWSVSSPSDGTVATIDSVTGTLTGKNAGTITVMASSQALAGTTIATVVEIVTSMSISPNPGSAVDDGSSYQAFLIKDQGGNNISSLVTLAASQGTTAVPQITCGYQFVTQDLMQDCQPAQGLVATGTAQYTITVNYAGYTGAPVTAILNVSAPAQ